MTRRMPSGSLTEKEPAPAHSGARRSARRTIFEAAARSMRDPQARRVESGLRAAASGTSARRRQRPPGPRADIGPRSGARQPRHYPHWRAVRRVIIDARSRPQAGPGDRLDALVPGTSRKRKRCARTANVVRISAHGERHADADMRADRERQVGIARPRRDWSGVKRSGSKRSGSGHNLRCRCTTHGITATNERRGIRRPHTVSSAAARADHDRQRRVEPHRLVDEPAQIDEPAGGRRAWARGRQAPSPARNGACASAQGCGASRYQSQLYTCSDVTEVEPSVSASSSISATRRTRRSADVAPGTAATAGRARRHSARPARLDQPFQQRMQFPRLAAALAVTVDKAHPPRQRGSNRESRSAPGSGPCAGPSRRSPDRRRRRPGRSCASGGG